MKKQVSFFSMLCLLGLLTACNNSSSKDAVDKADSANEKKADSNSTSMSDSNHANQSTTAAMTVDKETADFMVKAADGGMEEVEMGRMAGDKATNQRVKNFGQMMVDDHSKANDELKSLASQRNVTLPATVSSNHQSDMDNVNKKTGKDFDKKYMSMMVDDHQKDVSEFEKASKNVKDADVKAWIDKTLPVLRKHLDSAKAINKSVK
jgi:putative membrane protein